MGWGEYAGREPGGRGLAHEPARRLHGGDVMTDMALRARIALSEIEAMGLTLDDLIACAGHAPSENVARWPAPLPLRLGGTTQVSRGGSVLPVGIDRPTASRSK